MNFYIQGAVARQKFPDLDLMGMATSVEDAFNATSASYDVERTRLIPDYDSFYGWAARLVPAGAERVLDLGAGTGLLASWVRQRLPLARLHLVDFSTPMLDLARARFAGDDRVSFEVADYATGELGGAWDVVVSALSIHHLEDEAKRELFGRVHAALKPGGAFVNAEQVLGPTTALEAQYKREWLDEVRRLGATEEQIERSLFRQREDRCATVEDQLAWMRAAQFEEVDCRFKSGRFAVMAGVKSRS
jgi:tRNA (cmo5U34)-methyltransferase